MSALVAQQALTGLVRDRGVALLAVIFAVMVAVSAFLGWSATQTVNAIYARAVVWLTPQGAPIPPNPLHEMPPLASLRNLPVYVSFLGTFAAIVIHQARVETDRHAGVLPLTLACQPGAEHVVYYEDIYAMFAALDAGEVAGAADIAAVMAQEARSRPGSRVLSPPFMSICQAMGVPQGRPDAAAFLHHLLRTCANSGQIGDILEKHGVARSCALAVEGQSPLYHAGWAHARDRGQAVGDVECYCLGCRSKQPSQPTHPFGCGLVHVGTRSVN